MAKLTEDRIMEIQNLYKKIGTYSGVAKQLGCSAATVKKYCQEQCSFSYEPVTRIKFDGTIPPVSEIKWPASECEISKLARLTEDEVEEIEILWKEL